MLNRNAWGILEVLLLSTIMLITSHAEKFPTTSDSVVLPALWAELFSQAEIQSFGGPAAFLAANPAVPQLVPQIPSSPDREPVRILVVGRTAPSINSIVYALYLKRFAHISEWSDLQPHSPGRLMRVLTRYVSGVDE